MSAFLKEFKDKMQATVDHLVQELGGLRTGKANPAMLDGLKVEVYGASMRLKDLANATSPEPRQILITPFDGQNAPAIVKSIEKSNLGFQAMTEGNLVRITVPEMSQEVRDEMKKLCSKKGEDSKIGVRNVRRAAMAQAKKLKDDGECAEDQQKKYEKEIQSLTDDFCSKADELTKEKEKEIATI